MIGAAFALAAYSDTAKFGALVLDAEDRTPIPNVTVTASFSNSNGWKAWTESAPHNRDCQKTDKDGFCRLSGKTNIGDAGCWVDDPPAGYYAGNGRSFRYKSKNFFGIWQPDNLVATVLLQRVENPIPLYVRNVRTRNKKGELGGFDGTNAVLRFDFVESDWLPPDGNGKHADMIIRTCFRVQETISTSMFKNLTFYDYTNTIEFPEYGNGIYEESFAEWNGGIKFRVAPETGYVSSKMLKYGFGKEFMDSARLYPFGKDYTESDKNRCYCFRIRSKFNDKGELTEAYYGKIYGDFNFEGWEKTGFREIEFLYYLNPTSLARNLEWDMKNNLCDKPGKFQIEP